MTLRRKLLAFALLSGLAVMAGLLVLRTAAARSHLNSCAATLVAQGNSERPNQAAFGGPSNLIESVLKPKTEAMRRDPSGPTENVLTPLSPLFRDLSMRFNFMRARYGVAVAIGSLMISGCGGGGSSDDGALQAAVSSSSSASSASSTGAVSVTAPARSSSVSSGRSGMGTNLTSLSYYSGQYPTIDFMKKASDWLTQCTTWTNSDCKTSTWDTGEESQLDLDANGWVRSLPANGSSSAYRYVSTVILSGGTQPIGQYIVRYDGQGTLVYGGVATKVSSQSTSGRDVVNVVAGDNVFLLSITATTPSNYVRNIRVYPPGGACSGDMTTWVTSASACTSGKGSYVAFENFPSGSTWFPGFVKDLKGFRTLRFMDWGMTNVNPVTSWSGRTSPTQRVWSDPTGVPIEAMFDLAKTAGADPWLTIPPYVDDDYIHQFGKLAHQNLAAGQTLNLEYGNEMWNYSFPATSWALGQSKTAFASALAGGADQYQIARNWYAQRLVQACNIVKGEFGTDASRVRCIANSQVGNAFDMGQLLTCPYAGGACAKSIDVIAVAPYFAQYVGEAVNRPVVASWYADADGGLSELFQEIIGTDTAATASMTPPLASTSQRPGGALTDLKNAMVTSGAAASKYGKPMWAYEGGQSLVPPVNDTDQGLLSLMTAANRDARMGAAYQIMLQDWVAAGGQTFALFTDVGLYNKWGFWGLRENQFATTADSPKWKTAVQWRDSTACWWSGC